MYNPRRLPRTETRPIRDGHYHLRWWGAAHGAQPPLVLLHGWMDVGASYQFVVDALPEDLLRQRRRVVAPDWRGFGHTRMPSSGHHVFADYLADLDALLDSICPRQPADLVGHSMGGNVAMLYAGVRPQRVRRLVDLEGFGLPATQPDQAPAHYAEWLDQIKALRQGKAMLHSYASAAEVARRLMRTNPRLPLDKAEWLAREWAQAGADGRWHILADAAHRITGSQLYAADEVQAVWRQIRAPALVVEASDNPMEAWWAGRYTQAEFHQRLQAVPQARLERLGPAGHMLHHDQPEALAVLLADFIAAPAGT